MGMFALLIISVRCALSCARTNKMDVDRMDLIRKVSEIVFQLYPR